MYPTSLNKLIHTVSRSKEKLQTQSKQRRGGVTDLYALDYVGEISNLTFTETITTTETPPDEGSSDNEVKARVEMLTRYIKQFNPSATPIGIAGVVGNFARESGVTAKRYETDHIVTNKYVEMDEEPTAEKLVGSWDAFVAMYGGGLDKRGYLVNGKHYIGIGLGQWTGPRGKMLFDWAKSRKKSIFDFGTQVEFMFTKDDPNRIRQAFRITSINTSIEDSTRDFLANWEGVAGNFEQERVNHAKKWLPVIEATLKGETNSSPATVSSGTGSDSTTTSSDVSVRTNKKDTATFRVLIPADLDRFQRWFIKIAVSSLDQSTETEGVLLSDASLHIQAINSRSDKTINLDVTKIFRQKWACDWVGFRTSEEEIYPNNKPNEGFDIMDLAWYLNNDERDALFSAGEKVFTLRAIGNARVTLRNFLKFSHIN